MQKKSKYFHDSHSKGDASTDTIKKYIESQG